LLPGKEVRTKMYELERWSKKYGWRFVVTVVPGGNCIIQGGAKDSDGEWDFDIQAHSFDEAIIQALMTLSRLPAQGDKEQQPTRLPGM
jgi:hypothetical protein